MRYFFTPVLVVLFVLMTVSLSMAGTATIVEDVLLIPLTEEAPAIDGELDDVWNTVTATSMLYHEGKEVTNVWDTVGVYADHHTSYRVMWDEDYFYLFVQVVDDSLDGSEKGSPWMSDCVEVFFDGENDKASSYDANDVQWRWVYGEAPGDGGASNQIGEWVFLDTELGYNLEVRIGADTLASKYFQLEDDTEIGFEISNADRDEGQGQQDVLHWWTHTGTTWNDPTLFGTALLTSGASAIGDNHSMVSDFELGQNYPNPFNPSTTIAYSLNKTETVKLVVYNLLGQEVSVLVEGVKTVGQHTVQFNGADLPSGIYFYKLEAAGQIFTNKMMLIK